VTTDHKKHKNYVHKVFWCQTRKTLNVRFNDIAQFTSDVIDRSNSDKQ